jgi:hypothetical protein
MRLNGPVRLNGSVQIIRSSDSSYTLTHAPLGAGPGERPARRFEGARDLERFLAGPLRVARREILAALVALDRNGSYLIAKIWLSPDELARAATLP